VYAKFIYVATEGFLASSRGRRPGVRGGSIGVSDPSGA
jgi:hypothetical protein